MIVPIKITILIDNNLKKEIYSFLYIETFARNVILFYPCVSEFYCHSIPLIDLILKEDFLNHEYTYISNETLCKSFDSSLAIQNTWPDDIEHCLSLILWYIHFRMLNWNVGINVLNVPPSIVVNQFDMGEYSFGKETMLKHLKQITTDLPKLDIELSQEDKFNFVNVPSNRTENPLQFELVYVDLDKDPKYLIPIYFMLYKCYKLNEKDVQGLKGFVYVDKARGSEDNVATFLSVTDSNNAYIGLGKEELLPLQRSEMTEQVEKLMKNLEIDQSSAQALLVASDYDYENAKIMFRQQGGNKTAKISNVCIEQKYKDIGLTKRFISQIIGLLEINGYQTVQVEVDKSNEEEKKTYESLGFKLVSDKGEVFLMERPVKLKFEEMKNDFIITFVIHNGSVLPQICSKEKDKLEQLKKDLKEKAVEILDVDDKCMKIYTKLYGEEEEGHQEGFHSGYSIKTFFETFDYLKKYIDRTSYNQYKEFIVGLEGKVEEKKEKGRRRKEEEA